MLGGNWGLPVPTLGHGVGSRFFRRPGLAPGRHAGRLRHCRGQSAEAAFCFDLAGEPDFQLALVESGCHGLVSDPRFGLRGGVSSLSSVAQSLDFRVESFVNFFGGFRLPALSGARASDGSFLTCATAIHGPLRKHRRALPPLPGLGERSGFRPRVDYVDRCFRLGRVGPPRPGALRMALACAARPLCVLQR
eukprot:s2140_g6.t1